MEVTTASQAKTSPKDLLPLKNLGFGRVLGGGEFWKCEFAKRSREGVAGAEDG